MKKIILIACVAFLGSCVTQRTAYYNVSIGDYSKYVSDGILVFPLPPSETGYTDYTPVADIVITAQYGLNERGEWVEPTREYMLTKLVEEAKKRGADLIFNLEIVRSEKPSNEFNFTLTASGFAAKKL